MKKQFTNIFLIIILITFPCYILANSIAILKNRLNKINSFYAEFNQKIVSVNNRLLSESKGELWIKKPNFFNWHTIIPDENSIISDGETLWIYNPLIKQVTANWLSSIIDDDTTPFNFIISNKSSNWEKYNVRQKNNKFYLTSKFNNNSIEKIIIKITDSGIIKELIIVEQNGQCVDIEFKNHKNCLINSSMFNFVLPSKVILDDQR